MVWSEQRKCMNGQMQEYTPCVAEAPILGVCYLAFIILGSIRLGQLCGKRRMDHLRQKRRCWSYFVALLGVLVMLLYFIDIIKAFAPLDSIVESFVPSLEFGDVYGSEHLTPFQGVTNALAVTGWTVRFRGPLRAYN